MITSNAENGQILSIMRRHDAARGGESSARRAPSSTSVVTTTVDTTPFSATWWRRMLSMMSAITSLVWSCARAGALAAGHHQSRPGTGQMNRIRKASHRTQGS